jgi:hypothetical protein
MRKVDKSESSYYDSESENNESSVWEEYDPKTFFKDAMNGANT